MSNPAKIREIAAQLNPIDDAMFIKMAEDREFCEEILRVILEDPNLIVTENIPQWVGKNLQGRSVTLDVKCISGDGRQIDVEVQTGNNDDHQRRVRYNGSVLTTNVADPGIDFKQVPEVCVVYIAQFDVFESEKAAKNKHALYHVDRVVRELDRIADNGFQEVYVNALARTGTPVSELMEVFTEDSAYNEKFPKTSEIKGRFKNNEKEKKLMCTALNEYVQEINREAEARFDLERKQYAAERKQYAAERKQYAAREKKFAAKEKEYANERRQFADRIAELEAKLAKLQA